MKSMKKTHGILICTAAAIAGIAFSGSTLMAQDEAGPQLPPPPPAPVVLDDGIEAVKAAFIGSWKTTSTEYNADADETGGTMWMRRRVLQNSRVLWKRNMGRCMC